MEFFTIIYLVMFFFGIFFLMIFMVLHHKNFKSLFSYPKPKRNYSVTFLVPAYNEEDTIENTVDSLIELDYPNDLKEIIILNDGSKDRTKEISERLSKKYKEVKVINKKNSGKANSLNEGIKIAKGELLAVVDADSYPKKDALQKMIGYFDEKSVAAVTSRVLVKNKNNLLCRFQVLDYSIIAWTRKLLDFVDSVYVTNGPLSVYRTKVVKEVGGFDPNNLTEDIEITWHILSEGYQTRMSYSAVVYTSVPEKLNQWIKQRVRWNLGGIQTVQKYWKSMFNKGAFGYFVVPYVTASFILALIGFFLLMRYFFVQRHFFKFLFYYLFTGNDYLNYVSFGLNLTILMMFGISFFVMAIFYYKTGFKNSETGNQSVLKIISYSFLYRSLYIVPLLIAVYKLAKNDIRWYTK